ncbi:very long chain fatty acid elongase AAEL008004-like [Prorops nasuta]|uniref:very long chain fatty acid elongase AAEL008004-like n=1 Tax=Prorops nasuta TaxID=863751 RepID=UPI0034CE9DA8
MGLAEWIDYYWNQIADPRTNDWPLAGSIFPVPTILAVYLIFVFFIGPQYMKNRQPYSLKTFIKLYNIFQILANSWIVYSLIDAGWFTTITIYCEPMDYSLNYGPYKLATTMWWAILLKLSDLIETVVYILRKKHNQVSTLHLYHHVSTALIQWVCTKYIPGGMSTFFLLVNCSIHVIMYTYYYLSTLGPNVRSVILPYKRLLTILQMIQFWGLMFYSLQAFKTGCNVPRSPAYMMITNLLINFGLFFHFYQTSYRKPQKKAN